MARPCGPRVIVISRWLGTSTSKRHAHAQREAAVMTEEARSTPEERETTKETGALLLAIGGLAAAFGAASCCAIPMLLGSLGLGSAWLAGVAIVAAPHRINNSSGCLPCRSWSRAGLVSAGAHMRAGHGLRQPSDHASDHRVTLARCHAGDRRVPFRMIVLEAVITCPRCGHAKSETMPTNACQFFYECKGCGTLLKPRARDCCVFCSYGSVPCPPVQARSN